MKEVEKYIDSICKKGFVCPNPMIWDEFYKKFNENNTMSKPLILAAWYHTSATEKLNRLKEQLESISNGRSIEKAITFLEHLPDSDWHKG